jgi:hypothetical protein
MVKIRILLFSLLILALLETPAFCESSVELVVNALFQEGFGGKQVYDGSGDQHLELYEPMLFVSTQLTPETQMWFQGVYDTLTSASARAFDTGTGASGAAVGGGGGEGEGEDDEGAPGGSGGEVWEERYGLDLGVSQKLSTWVLGASAGYSSQLTYRSRHGGLNVTKGFADDNFILSLGMFYFGDEEKNYDLALVQFTDWIPRITRSVNFSASQLLGPADLVLAGVSYTRQTGILTSNRNTVEVPTGRIMEVLPDLRDKWTGTLRYVHGLSPWLAFHFDYRYYVDSWALTAHAWEPSLAFGSDDETDLVRLVYRFYLQNAVQYYQDAFPVPAAFMTQDSDLAAFAANEVRVHYSHRLEGTGALQGLELGGTALYYRRTNDLRAWVLQAGISGTF